MKLFSGVEPFKEKYISAEILTRLLNIDLYKDFEFDEEANRSGKQNFIYEYGKAADFFVLIVNGNAELETGKEKIISEIGSFHYFGVSALYVSNIQGGFAVCIESRKCFSFRILWKQSKIWFDLKRTNFVHSFRTSVFEWAKIFRFWRFVVFSGWPRSERRSPSENKSPVAEQRRATPPANKSIFSAKNSSSLSKSSRQIRFWVRIKLLAERERLLWPPIFRFKRKTKNFSKTIELERIYRLQLVFLSKRRFNRAKTRQSSMKSNVRDFSGWNAILLRPRRFCRPRIRTRNIVHWLDLGFASFIELCSPKLISLRFSV